MKKEVFTDELDTLLFNLFETGDIALLKSDFFSKQSLSIEILEKRYHWLKTMGINPNLIHLKENHQMILEIFDRYNQMLNENNIEYYYTTGILSYLLVNKRLERYHHDLDIFINMNDLEKLEKICGSYDFTFERKLGNRNDGTNRIMLKMYYQNNEEIPITVFMYERNKDNSIVQNDYFISEENEPMIEKIYNSPKAVELSFSDEPHFHNQIRYYAITLEALYLSKMANRPKDIYDCTQFENKVDFNKVSILEKELNKSKENDVQNAITNRYYDFIFLKYFGEKKLSK